jgi:NAD-dependent SIR2 family protein deacetylase
MLGLEEAAGVPAKRICYAHGSLQWASCGTCNSKVPQKSIEYHILRGTVPYCQAPRNGSGENVAPIRVSPRKRAWSERSKLPPPTTTNNYIGTSGEAVCGGVMKPGVTFFGEALHNTVKQKLEWDRDRVDALIVIGTSLSV